MSSCAALKWLVNFLGKPSTAATVLTYIGFIVVAAVALKLWSYAFVGFRNFVWARWRNVSHKHLLVSFLIS
jgi:hypothetical protein